MHLERVVKFFIRLNRLKFALLCFSLYSFMKLDHLLLLERRNFLIQLCTTVIDVKIVYALR